MLFQEIDIESERKKFFKVTQLYSKIGYDRCCHARSSDYFLFNDDFFSHFYEIDDPEMDDIFYQYFLAKRYISLMKVVDHDELPGDDFIYFISMLTGCGIDRGAMQMACYSSGVSSIYRLRYSVPTCLALYEATLSLKGFAIDNVVDMFNLIESNGSIKKDRFDRKFFVQDRTLCTNMKLIVNNSNWKGFVDLMCNMEEINALFHR